MNRVFCAEFLTFCLKPASFESEGTQKVGAPLPAGLGASLACPSRALPGLKFLERWLFEKEVILWQ